METAILTVIALLALVVWRLAFAGLQRRLSYREVPASDQEENVIARQRLPNLGLPYVGIITGSGWNPSSHRTNPADAESRAETYLRRIAELIGATQKGNCYVLDVGKTRFEVRDRFARRLRDISDPKCAYDETCFYSTFQGMPKAEQIAAALLQLRNNPGLFDRWAQRDLAFKADGQLFARV